MTLDDRSSDVLTEIVNIGVGYSAGILQTILDSHIQLRIPRVELLRPEHLPGHLGAACVHLGFKGFLMGNAVMFFSRESASNLARLLDPESPDGSIMTEVGNLVLNGIIGTISNLLSLHLDYEVPVYTELPLQEWLARQQSLASILLVRSTISVENHPIEGELMLCLDSKSAQEFLGQFRN